MSAIVTFLCSQFDKAISNLVSFGTERFRRKITSVHCSLTRKTDVYFVHIYFVFCEKKIKLRLTKK
jgi:hypothetical protein